MAIGSLPPWLHVNPSDFVRAAEAGAQTGMGIAHLRQQAAQFADQQDAQRQAQEKALAERQAEMAYRTWEANERLRALAQRAKDSNELREKLSGDSLAERLASTEATRKSMEKIAADRNKRLENKPQKIQVQRDGSGQLWQYDDESESWKPFGGVKPNATPKPNMVTVVMPPPVGGTDKVTRKVPEDQYNEWERQQMNPGVTTNSIPARPKWHGIPFTGRDARQEVVTNTPPTLNEFLATNTPAGTLPLTADAPNPGVIPGVNASPIEDAIQPPPSSATPKKVRVKNPQGQWGMIPAEQLDDALKAGYSTEETPQE